jgi:MFS family permease
MPTTDPGDILRLFRLPDFWHLLITRGCATLASRALVVVVGYQVYELTKSPLALGLLGLVEAIPALSLALYGGHVADRYERRSILTTSLPTLSACAAVLGVLTAVSHHGLTLASLYGVIFVVGIARGLAEPATSALEAQVVPADLIVRSAPWFTSSWLICAITGPVVGGAVYAAGGPSPTYVLFAVLYAAAWLAASRLSPHSVPPAPEGESIWQSIAEGVRYVAFDQILLGSMALDLFAVLFGGVIAILPIFAKDILHVGPIGLGFLNAAPHAGALVTMLIATVYPPVRYAGRSLLIAVAGFGVTMIVFALSTNFYLSLLVLVLSGVCDGVSVVVRRSIVRLFSPDHLRGRIAAVSMIFIGSSNELGALESGLAASWLGVIPSVFAGGSVTLLVVALTTILAPRLRRLHLDVPPEN